MHKKHPTSHKPRHYLNNSKPISQQQLFVQQQQQIQDMQQQPVDSQRSQEYNPSKSKTRKQSKPTNIKKTTKPMRPVYNKSHSELRKAGRKEQVWLTQQRKRYWMFFLETFLEDSRMQISWTQWKNQSFFPNQARYICDQMTHKVVKAYDQRQKDEWEQGKKTVDILDTAVEKLMKEYVETNFDEEVYELLVRFKKAMDVQNEVTKFIEEREVHNMEVMNRMGELRRQVQKGSRTDSIFTNDPSCY